MLNSHGFDLWANGYDKCVSLSEQVNEYPFAGYKKVLGTIYDSIRSGDGKRVLDIGLGTGILAKKLYDEGYSICGIDFSAKMIEIAKQKMPNAMLIQCDFTNGLSAFPFNRAFDFIVCTYAIHHLDNPQKIMLIKELTDHLSAGGKILIGDVAFETIKEMEQCRAQCGSAWDSDESYPVEEVLKSIFPLMHFNKISFCSGVLSLEK